TYGCVQSPRNFRITINMPHSHRDGWAPKEIGLFMDQYLKNGVPLPTVMKPSLSDDKLFARVESQSHPASASLHYTTGTTPINKLDWESVPARIEGDLVISSAPPEEATIWFLTVTDDRGAVVSSELVFSVG
ncbi:MAG: acylamino acid-releasing protein, partial [Planctomycetes bacterium]|nr:acylamino acid-releasing protein [Planctomycetota bacterium]